MELVIEKGTISDIDELERLYDELVDSLVKNINYPGWIKGLYPVRENAIKGIEENHLYVARHHNKIAGTVILNHKAEDAYLEVSENWGIEADDNEVFVIHTFAIHPDFLRLGIGEKLMEFARELGKQSGIKAIRLDVYENNTPAIRLYEKSGFQFIGTVDLGLGEYGLDRFRLYQMVL